MPPRPKVGALVRPAIAVLVLATAALVLLYVREERRAAVLVRLTPTEVLQDPKLVDFALGIAKPVYAAHCARCHGDRLTGARAAGAPRLASGAWLYGFGDVIDLEATILYGVRSGHPKAHNVTDMPAFGRIGQLSASEVHDVVEYVLSLSHAADDAGAVGRGLALYNDKGSCYDCHSADASGNVDYGAPALTAHAWLYGGDRTSLYDSVFNGRHGLCPAWINHLKPVEIRALAVYLHTEAQRAPGVGDAPT